MKYTRSWTEIKNDYEQNYVMFSCKPDPKTFPRLASDAIIDEDMPVKWNREQVAKSREAYDEEVKRLNRQRNDNRERIKNEVADILQEENNFTREQAIMIWDKARENSDYPYQLFNNIEDYADFLDTFIKAGNPAKKK